MLHLSINHNIHLSREQRYRLHNGGEVNVVGISIPVWHNKHKTSEPAKEVFCMYRLRNSKLEIPIQILDDGYLIYMPNRPGQEKPLSDEEWRYLNMHNREALSLHYKQCVPEMSAKNLLDSQDGGSECLIYREHNKIKKNERLINIVHFVNMNKIEHLTDSL